MREQLHNNQIVKTGIFAYVSLRQDGVSTAELHDIFGRCDLRPEQVDDALRELLVTPWLDAEPPRLDENSHTIHFQGKSCPLGDNAMFRFMRLLVEANGGWVEYLQIIEECLEKDAFQVKNFTVRGLKSRLVEKLRHHGLADLASRIKAGTEKYRLDLS